MSYAEPMVARVLNVNRETIASARKASLVKGSDWTLENSVVHYPAAGLKKLLGALGVSDASLARFDAPTATGDPAATPPRATADPEKNSPGTVAGCVAAARAADSARSIVALIVTSLSRNPTIVHARPAAGGEPVLVRVRTNENFMAGMPISARAPAPGSTLYFFEGHCPRWKGRY